MEGLEATAQNLFETVLKTLVLFALWHMSAADVTAVTTTAEGPRDALC